MKFGIARPAQEVALTPLTEVERRRWKVLLRGVYNQAGGAAAGLLLIGAAPFLNIHSPVVPIAAAATALAWLVLQLAASKRYLDTLGSALGLRRLSLRDAREELLIDREGLARVVQLAGSSDETSARFGRELLATYAQDPRLLIPYIGMGPTAQRVTLYRLLAQRPHRAVRRVAARGHGQRDRRRGQGGLPRRAGGARRRVAGGARARAGRPAGGRQRRRGRGARRAAAGDRGVALPGAGRRARRQEGRAGRRGGGRAGPPRRARGRHPAGAGRARRHHPRRGGRAGAGRGRQRGRRAAAPGPGGVRRPGRRATARPPDRRVRRAPALARRDRGAHGAGPAERAPASWTPIARRRPACARACCAACARATCRRCPI